MRSEHKRAAASPFRFYITMAVLLAVVARCLSDHAKTQSFRDLARRGEITLIGRQTPAYTWDSREHVLDRTP